MHLLYRLTPLALCAACSTPHPAFFDAEKHVVEVENSRFVVYEKLGAVEIYRTSVEYLPPLPQVHARAEIAVRQATGCSVVKGSLKGDHALMRALLDCGEGRILPPEKPGFTCEIDDPEDPYLVHCEAD